MAIDDLRTAIALNLNFSLAHYGLGFAYFWGAGQADEAVPHFDAVLRLSPRGPLRWVPFMLTRHRSPSDRAGCTGAAGHI